jgi:hypothetical protein
MLAYRFPRTATGKQAAEDPRETEQWERDKERHRLREPLTEVPVIPEPCTPPVPAPAHKADRGLS